MCRNWSIDSSEPIEVSANDDDLPPPLEPANAPYDNAIWLGGARNNWPDDDMPPLIERDSSPESRGNYHQRFTRDWQLPRGPFYLRVAQEWRSESEEEMVDGGNEDGGDGNPHPSRDGKQKSVEREIASDSIITT